MSKSTGNGATSDAGNSNLDAANASDKTPAAYDLHFLVKDEKTGKPLSGIPYKLTLETGEQVTGITDANGLTETIDSDELVIAKLEAPYYGDSTSSTHTHDEHSACGC